MNLPDYALIQGDVLPVEEALIACVLLERAGPVPPLSPDEFWSEHHRIMWRALLRLVEQGVRPDLVSLNYELRRRDELKYIPGGEVTLAGIVERACIADQVTHYAQVIRGAARERLKRQLGTELASQGLDDEEILRRLDELPGALGAAPIYDPADNWRRIVESWRRGRLMSGFDDLDSLIGGFGLGEFVVVGGRTSHGKTAYLCALALRLAERGVEVTYITLEESVDAITRRLIAVLSGARTRQLKDGTVPREWFDEAQRAVVRLQALPLVVAGVDYVGSLEESAVLGSVGALRSPVVIVDHLQQVTTRDQSRAYGLERVLKRLQSLALRDNKLLIVASQLNRETEARQGPPRLSDLRDTGAIEQAARVILLLYWPCKHHEERDQGDYEVYVAKQADGPTGLVNLRFESWCGRFA